MSHKYGAKSVTVDGHKFPSKVEARRYGELKLLERAGEIRNLELQPEYKFTIEGAPLMIGKRQARFRADFRYFDVKTGKRVVEDIKSAPTRTEAYVLRKALVEHLFPGTVITEVGKHNPAPWKTTMAHLCQAPIEAE